MTDVLIAGAGATGLTLGIELLRRGIGVRVVDVAEGPFGGSRGKGIQPRSLEIFDMMGVVDEVLVHSSLYQPLKLHLGPITKVMKSLGTAYDPTEDRPHPNMMMVPQWCTEEALRRHFEQLGGTVEYRTGLQSLVQESDSVTATLSDGTTLKSRYLVGCDGARSVVRKALSLPLVGKSIDDKTMIVADFELEGLDRNFWHVWPLHKGGTTAFAPLPLPNLWQLQASERIAKDGLEEGIFKTLGIYPGRIVWQSRFRHQIRMVEHYRRDNVFLAGDSAHIHPPSGAQGLNTGVQDAWNLGWKLAAALRTGDAAILDSYEQERLPVAAHMLDLTSTLLVKASADRDGLTNQLTVGYRDGPLTRGAGDGDLHPGDRMPDMLLTDGRRLIQVMRSGNSAQVLLPSGKRALIRPDGYIAEFSDQPVGTYFGFVTEHVEQAHASQ